MDTLKGDTMIDLEAAKEATLGVVVMIGLLLFIGLGVWGLASLIKWGVEHDTTIYVFGGMVLGFLTAIWFFMYEFLKFHRRSK